MALGQGSDAGPPRGRAPAAVLAATEGLLRDRPAGSLSVGDIIARAGVSRTTFYAHFSSKDEVIASCLRGVMDDVAAAVAPFHSYRGDDPLEAVRVSLERWADLGTAHGALLRAVSEQWPHDEELRRLWFSILDGFVAGTQSIIERARARGQAPAGADPRALAACLIWTCERVLHVALVGEAAELPRPEAIVEPLTQMVLGGLFGRPLHDVATTPRTTTIRSAGPTG